MPDRRRPDPSLVPDGAPSADHDSLIEQLLLTGLDQYFAGQYERAISAWTRVLFLDRGHARAKAYIDRARGAIGERQRESDELLHRGVDAFNRGETETARGLLTAAVERGGPQEVALAFLDRLARLDRPGGSPGAQPEAPIERRLPRRVAAPGHGGRRPAWTLPGLVLGVIILGLFYLQASRERAAPLLFLLDWGRPGAVGAGRVADEPLPIPRAAEVDLERARALAESGHPRDALRLVDRIRPDDPLRVEAARLRETIQRTLLSGMEGNGSQPIANPPTGANGSTGRDQ